MSGALGLGTGPIGSGENTALNCSDRASAFSSSEQANVVDSCFHNSATPDLFFNFDWA